MTAVQGITDLHAADSSFCYNMAKRFSLQETLDYVFYLSDEDVQDTASDDSSETGDNPELDQEPIGRDEETSDEEDTDEDPDTYLSKNGRISWTSSPPSGKHSKAALQMRPGITRYACSHAEDIKSTFQLFLTEEIQEIVLRMTNVEGRRVYANEWIMDLDLADIQAYIGVVILAGVYWSNNENMESLPQLL